MRTTITLDPDVAQRARTRMARSGKRLKQVINEALRAGFDNITGSKNPTFVDNNVNSTNFLALGNFGHRSFNGRIRLLGPK